MKKIVITSIIFIAATTCFFMLKKPAPHPSTSGLEVKLKALDALLICTNLRAKNIKNKLGNLTVSATEGYVMRDHTIQATTVTARLEQPNAKLTTITAKHATLTPTTRTLTLVGNVQAQQGDVSLKSDELALHMRSHEMIANGHVIIQAPQGLVSTNQALFNHQEGTLKLEGHVRSELSSMPARTLQR